MAIDNWIDMKYNKVRFPRLVCVILWNVREIPINIFQQYEELKN